MRGRKKLHIFLFLLAGALIGVMLTMMRLGGSVNFKGFMSAGRVYDFEPSVLQRSTKGWCYERQNGGHRFLNDKAQIKFRLNGKKRVWSYLYITVDELDPVSVEGLLRYYDRKKNKVYEQPITLTQGKNRIPMDGMVPVRWIGIAILDARGGFISVSDMQIRTMPSWFTVPHFLELFAVAFAGSLFALFVLILLWRVVRNRFFAGRVAPGWLLYALQDGIRIFGDFLGRKMGGRLYPCQQESVRKFLFSLLFVWMMIGNAAGWLTDKSMYRYHVLVCAVILVGISLLSWEKPLQNQFWGGPLMKSWLFLWLGMILCDFFVKRRLESVAGCAMLLAGSVFGYFWQNMTKPRRLLCDIMESLEITFFLAVLYCMAFRLKQPAVDYNGMFKSPEELAMYAVLMEAVFLTEMDWLVCGLAADSRGKPAGSPKTGGGFSGARIFASCVKNITGGALALFFVLRSGHALGIAIFALLAIGYVPFLAATLFRMAAGRRGLLAGMTAAAILAYGCTGIVFVSTKYVPEILGMDVKYKHELLLTELEGEQRNVYLMQFPGSLDGVRTKEIEKLPVIWRNYARRMNLFGHGGWRKVFRRKILPYNSYLDMAYHHGIFILLPYLAFQIAIIAQGVKGVTGKKGRRDFCLLFLGISYLCFAFGANVEISWGHPFWLCYYLAAGYLGRMETEENLRKEGVM